MMYSPSPKTTPSSICVDTVDTLIIESTKARLLLFAMLTYLFEEPQPLKVVVVLLLSLLLLLLLLNALLSPTLVVWLFIEVDASMHTMGSSTIPQVAGSNL